MLFRKEGESAYHQNILDTYNFLQSISNYAIKFFLETVFGLDFWCQTDNRTKLGNRQVLSFF